MKKLIIILLLIFGFFRLDSAAQQKPPVTNDATGGEKSRTDNQSSSPDIIESNRLTAENNRQINQALADGVTAFRAKNYRLAIEKFEAGYRLAPDYWGTAPTLLNNKAIALRLFGVEIYNLALKEKRNAAREARGYFQDAVLALKESKKILENTALPADETQKAFIENTLFTAIKELAESYRLLTITDPSRRNEAIEAYKNYIKIEKDETLRLRAEENLRKLQPRFKRSN